METTETWLCSDCEHEDTGPIDGLVGDRVEKVIGKGRRQKVIETVICPNCSSDNWHSESIRTLIEN